MISEDSRISKDQFKGYRQKRYDILHNCISSKRNNQSRTIKSPINIDCQEILIAESDEQNATNTSFKSMSRGRSTSTKSNQLKNIAKNKNYSSERSPNTKHNEVLVKSYLNNKSKHTNSQNKS